MCCDPLGDCQWGDDRHPCCIYHQLLRNWSTLEHNRNSYLERGAEGLKKQLANVEVSLFLIQFCWSFRPLSWLLLGPSVRWIHFTMQIMLRTSPWKEAGACLQLGPYSTSVPSPLLLWAFLNKPHTHKSPSGSASKKLVRDSFSGLGILHVSLQGKKQTWGGKILILPLMPVLSTCTKSTREFKKSLEKNFLLKCV